MDWKGEENGNSKRIEKAQAEEDKAIAVLEKIREDKQIFKYVYHNQPAEIAKIVRISTYLWDY